MSTETALKTGRPEAGRPLPDRRAFLYHLGAGLGSVALTALLARERIAGGEVAGRSPSGVPHGSRPAGPLAARRPHHAARARACIFLTMEGGPSHLDTFDPKPRLQRLHLTEFQRQDRFASAM